MSKLSIKGISEKLDKLNKSNPLRYMINGSKNMVWSMVWFLSNTIEETPLQQFLLGIIYLFDSIFSSIVCINKLHNCVEGICFSV